MAELTLQGIVDGGLCAGCGACVYAAGEHALQMQLDAAGFMRPVTTGELSAQQQARIRAVCPGIGLEHPDRFEAGTRMDPVWGPIRSLMAGHALDPVTRHQGSSGGVLSALLIHLLESGKVDFVLHVRAAQGRPLENEAVFSRSRQDVLEAAGSRYAPASPVAALPSALAQPGRFAFVGKPCDVAAVRKIIDVDPGLKLRIPFLISFMCAGTPSQKGTHAILKQLDVDAMDVVGFRYRGDGWPGLARAVVKDGRICEMDYNTAWGRILNRHLQTRCKLCADGTGEFADVVCADAWYGKDGYPDFAEREGRSLVIARTAVGEALCNAGEQAVSLVPFPHDDLRVIQPYQWQRKSSMQARLLALRLLRRRVPGYRRMSLHAAARNLSLRRLAREFAGTLMRSFRGRV